MPHFILDACGKDSQSIGTLHVYSQDGVEERVNTFKEPRPKALEVGSLRSLHHIVAYQITCQASCRYTVQMTGSALLIRFTQVFDVTNTSHCSLGTFQDKLSIKSMYKIL